MKIKIVHMVKPLKTRSLKHLDIFSWEAYTGLTDEQEEFYARTYVDYISGRRGVREKKIYLSNN